MGRLIRSFTLLTALLSLAVIGLPGLFSVGPALAADGVEITQTATPDPAEVGEPVVYVVQVTNNTGAALPGGVPAGAVLVGFGPGVTVNSVSSPNGSCSKVSPQNAVCFLSALAAGASAQITLNLTPSGDSIVGTVQAFGVTHVHEVAVGAVELMPEVTALEVTKTASAEAIRVGDLLTYTITVVNVGDTLVEDAELVDTLPAQVRLASGVPVSTSQGTCTWGGSTVTCNLQSLDVGQQATVIVHVEAIADGEAVNTVDVEGFQATATTTVRLPARIEISQESSSDPVIVGEEMTFSVTITNLEDEPINGVVLLNVVPSSARFIQAAPRAGYDGHCTWSDLVTCDFEVIGAGESVVVDIRLVPLEPGPFPNTASVGGVTSELEVTAQLPPQIEVVQVTTPDPLIATRPGTIELRVHNLGPGTASGLIVTDRLPDGLAFQSAAPVGGGACTWSTVVTCDLLPISEGDTTVVQIHVVPSTEGEYTNTVTIQEEEYTFPVTVVPLDTTPPVIAVSVSPEANAAGWHRTPVQVTWSVSDPESGVAETTECGTVEISQDSASIAGTTLTCAAENGHGFSSALSITLFIDMTTPTLTFGPVSTTPNDAGWYTTLPSFPFTVDDGLSGVASVSHDSPVVVDQEGEQASIVIIVTDVAGNQATFTTPALKVDVTAPAVTINAPVDGASYVQGETATVSFSCADAASGVASCAASVADGALLDTSTPGTYQFTVTATDNAGNVVVETVEYTIVEASTSQFSLDDFVLLAIERLVLDPFARVESGSVGVNNAATGRSYSITIGSSAQVLGPGAFVVGDRVLMNWGAAVGDVYANHLQAPSGATYGEFHQGLDLPLMTIPDLPDILPGSSNVNVAHNGTVVLEPGAYGNVQVAPYGTLILTGGTYHFKSLNLGSPAQLIVQGPSQVLVSNVVNIGPHSYVGPETGSTPNLTFVVGSGAVNFGSPTTVYAAVFAPNSTVTITPHSQFTGSVIGKTINVGSPAVVNLAPVMTVTEGSGRFQVHEEEQEEETGVGMLNGAEQKSGPQEEDEAGQDKGKDDKAKPDDKGPGKDKGEKAKPADKGPGKDKDDKAKPDEKGPGKDKDEAKAKGDDKGPGKDEADKAKADDKGPGKDKADGNAGAGDDSGKGSGGKSEGLTGDDNGLELGQSSIKAVSSFVESVIKLAFQVLFAALTGKS